MQSARESKVKKLRLMILAGETSGDLQAANLLKSLKSINPSIEAFGMGGKKMSSEGAEILYNITDLAVVGFFEVLKHFGTFKKIFEKLSGLLETRRPDAVILVDYPGFNLRFAKTAKEKNIPVIYYISPQIWAWGENRIHEIKKCVDKIIVIFGFEETIYKEAGVKVSFVGHPFLDIVKPEWKKEETIKTVHLKHDSIKIALMPGSRKKEIEKHLPSMLASCEIIKNKIPSAEFVISRIKELDQGLYNKIVKRSTVKPHFLDNKPYEVMDIADLVIVSSGSATLEAAIMEKPMVIIYKTSFLTWLLAKNLIKIPDIGLVNIVAGQRIVPELVQFNATPENIAKESLDILTDHKKIHEIKENLRKVKSKLGEIGASSRAARAIYKFLNLS
ncbi:MAG: lipid-A-disaccharide synthase [Candidatus Omnitrophica bacterium CG12_big_fil_rev_8_21_14_0_65_42_8]|nr:MAG: lipid-A-disaccharide synthase [Candidatus Omnitrophica bacterium CG12_big_fil_rev_8_21_14_0_65_42_8]